MADNNKRTAEAATATTTTSTAVDEHRFLQHKYTVEMKKQAEAVRIVLQAVDADIKEYLVIPQNNTAVTVAVEQRVATL
jgi:hypothetical protein